MHSSNVRYGLSTDNNRASLFSNVKKLGFQGIELGIGLDYRKDALWLGDHTTCQTIKNEAQMNDIEIASICLHLLNYEENSPASGNFESRKVGRKIILNTINTSALVNSPLILVPFFGTALLKSDSQKRILVEEMKALSKYAEANSVCLGLETSLGAFELGEIIDSVGSDCVQVYYDIGNSASKGYDLVQEIRTLNQRIVQVHVKDFPSRTLGEGNIDLRKVIRTLKKFGYDDYLVLETPSLDDPSKAAARNLSYLESLVGQ